MHTHDDTRTGLSRLMMLLMAGLLGLSVSAGLSGCNTMEGAGEDIEEAGEEVDETFED